MMGMDESLAMKTMLDAAFQTATDQLLRDNAVTPQLIGITIDPPQLVFVPVLTDGDVTTQDILAGAKQAFKDLKCDGYIAVGEAWGVVGTVAEISARKGKPAADDPKRLDLVVILSITRSKKGVRVFEVLRDAEGHATEMRDFNTDKVPVLPADGYLNLLED